MPLFNDGNSDLPAKGLQAEDVFLLWINMQEGVSLVRDVRADKEWQRREVDFIVFYDDGTQEYFEVKNDIRAADTGKVYTEYARVYRGLNGQGHQLKYGWNIFTHADRVAVWVPPIKTFYFYKPADMLFAWRILALQGVHPQRYPSDANCHTWSLYVPKDLIHGLEIVHFDPSSLTDIPF